MWIAATCFRKSRNDEVVVDSANFVRIMRDSAIFHIRFCEKRRI
ncbi:hypothetical protein [Helicobacter sp. 23-1045]